jgi:ABC-type hemin transport system ATPase subunit
MPPVHPVIHVLFFAAKADNPVVLPLTSKYDATLEKTPQTGQGNQYLLSITEISKPLALELGVASFTTLYGENGSGKTAMLLALCESLAGWSSESQISLLWEDRNGLHLCLGGALQDCSVKSEITITDIKALPAPDFLAAFYTTSPYERARRARLKSYGVRDISTKVSQVQEADPIAAFSAFPYLEGRADFVSKTQVEIKLKSVPLVDLLKTHGRWGAKTYNTLDSKQKSNIQRLSRTASPATKFILSYVVLNGIESLAEHDLYELIDALVNLIRENSPFLDDQLTSNRVLIGELSNDPLLTKQLLKAHQALEATSALFGDLKKWRRSAQLSYLDERIGREIRLNEGLLSEVAALGLLEFSFKELSSGQASMMFLYCAVAKAIGEFERHSTASHLLLCLDEGEMFMHPKWQRIYIADLLEFIRQFPSAAKRTHVCISTHSLIVAADTPSGRLFDLDQKQLTNAFGLTPKQTLTSVFDVENFTGKFNHQLLKKLADVLNSDVRSRVDIEEAQEIAETLANNDLKRHVQQQLDILGRKTNAQA